MVQSSLAVDYSRGLILMATALFNRNGEICKSNPLGKSYCVNFENSLASSPRSSSSAHNSIKFPAQKRRTHSITLGTGISGTRVDLIPIQVIISSHKKGGTLTLTLRADQELTQEPTQEPTKKLRSLSFNDPSATWIFQNIPECVIGGRERH